MKNRKIKNLIFTFIAFIFFYVITYYLNSNITIKALFKDDLASWSWFPGLSFFDYAFKFYDSATRYRPIYYALEYIEYYIIGNNVKWFTYYNVLLNSIIATFIFYFSKKYCKNSILSTFISLLYIISHLSYYQITQVIGILESYALMFSLIILYLLFSYIENNNKNNLKLIAIYILYLFVSFTHERYMFLAIPIFMTIFFKFFINNNNNNKTKTIISHSFIFLMEIIFIIIIRIFSTGKFIPAGTGGTEVTDTFNFIEALCFAINQLKIIFGLNIGPDYLVGIEYDKIDKIIKYILFLSIIALLSIILIYIITKIKYILKQKNENLLKYIYHDILFISFIALAIGSSSVTIRIELRFVYVSFTASMLYLVYMINSIKDYTYYNKNNNNVLILVYVLFFTFFFSRNYVELYYRKYYKNIHCITDLLRVNSLADLTVNKYGIKELKNKNVYIIYNFYEFTNFYCEYFYKIYDKNYEGLTIQIIKDTNSLPKNLDINKDIILIEDIENFSYKDISNEIINIK